MASKARPELPPGPPQSLPDRSLAHAFSLGNLRSCLAFDARLDQDNPFVRGQGGDGRPKPSFDPVPGRLPPRVT